MNALARMTVHDHKFTTIITLNHMKDFYRKLSFLALAMAAVSPSVMAEKLTGTPIGTERGWNYETNSEELNIAYKAFDGDLNTYYASCNGDKPGERSYAWVGLDLGTPHVINRVGWAPRNQELGPGRVVLGIFQGANTPDFMDAVPIYIITEKGTIGTISYADVNCSRGFRYVRYVGPSDVRCNIAEIEFYGEAGEGDDSHMYQLTNIPTVCINTLNGEIPYDKENEISSQITIIHNNKIDTDNKAGGVRERGNASRQFPKKPWRIKFDKKQKVLGSPAKAKKWTLINNYGDKTLMRNILAFETARRMKMPFVPFCEPVDVVMNGEYKGCYQLCDQVEVNPGRVEITEMAPEDNSGDALTGGYFIEIDGYAEQEPPMGWFRTSQHGNLVTIKSPKDDEITQEQYDYLKNYFELFESKIYGTDYNSEKPSYWDYLDVESFLRYFIVEELTGNIDAFWSTYMYKDRGSDKFVTGPVWDFDLAFENDYRVYPIKDKGKFTFLSMTEGSSSAGDMKTIVKRIMTHSALKKQMSQLWSIARNRDKLTYESMAEYIDETAAKIDASQKLNFTRWPILGEHLHCNPVIYYTFSGEVNAVKNYLRERFQQLDGVRFMNYDPEYDSLDDVEASEPVSVFVSGGVISFNGEQEFTVYAVDGTKVHAGAAPTKVLTPGVYIVTAAGYAPAKVLVK